MEPPLRWGLSKRCAGDAEGVAGAAGDGAVLLVETVGVGGAVVGEQGNATAEGDGGIGAGDVERGGGGATPALGGGDGLGAVRGGVAAGVG